MALINHRWQRKSVLKTMLDADTFNANLPEVPCRQSSCGAWLEFGSAWREYKWAILEEIERIPSGDSIVKGDFMQSAPAVALFQNKCHCQVACFSKGGHCQGHLCCYKWSTEIDLIEKHNVNQMQRPRRCHHFSLPCLPYCAEIGAY